MNIGLVTNDADNTGEPATKLMLLQQILSGMLMKIRNQEDLYQFYAITKSRYMDLLEENSCVSFAVDTVFKTLMAQPPELLDLVILPAMLRYIDWSGQARTNSGGARVYRWIVTPSRCWNFLHDDVEAFQHGAHMCQRVFEAVNILQQLQMVLFCEKPRLQDKTDPDSETLSWAPLDTPRVMHFVQSLQKEQQEPATMPQMHYQGTHQEHHLVEEYNERYLFQPYQRQDVDTLQQDISPKVQQQKEKDDSLSQKQDLRGEGSNPLERQQEQSILGKTQQHSQKYQRFREKQKDAEGQEKPQEKGDIQDHQKHHEKEGKESEEGEVCHSQNKQTKNKCFDDEAQTQLETSSSGERQQEQTMQAHGSSSTQTQPRPKRQNKQQTVFSLPTQKLSAPFQPRYQNQEFRRNVDKQKGPPNSAQNGIHPVSPFANSECQSAGYESLSLLQQSLPGINQRLNYLTIENNKLRQQDTMLMQQIYSLRKVVASLQKTMASISLPLGLNPKGKVSKFKRSAATTPIHSNFMDGSANSSMTTVSCPVAYTDPNASHAGTEEFPDPLLEDYGTFLVKNNYRPTTMHYCSNQQHSNILPGSQAVLSFQSDPIFDVSHDATGSVLSYQTVPLSEPSIHYSNIIHPPLPLNTSSYPLDVKHNHVNSMAPGIVQPQLAPGMVLNSGSAGGVFISKDQPVATHHAYSHTLPSSVSYKAKRPRPRYKESQGSKLTKGIQYRPPVTPEGKNYLVDEEGKFSIVMNNDQDSIYSIYNEFYQSLKLQVESFVQDYGKSKLVQFRKKRTFQKKKAFVYLIEKIAYFTQFSAEQVLDIVDSVRTKEEKSVVWVCNNLGSLKYALIKYHPELREVITSEPD